MVDMDYGRLGERRRNFRFPIVEKGGHMKRKFDLLTIQEASQYLKISKSNLYRICKQGIIPSMKIGGCLRIDREDLNQFISDHYQKPYTNL